MMKRFFYFLLTLSLLGACASLRAERKVEGNVFYSSYPKMTVEVSETHNFLGSERKARDTQYEHGPFAGTAFTETFAWKSSIGVLVISFMKSSGGVPWVFPADEWVDNPNVQDKGRQKLGKYGYEYCVLQERDGRFIKVFARNFSNNSLRVHIIYRSSLYTLNLSEFEEDCRNAFRVDGQKLPKTDLQQELEKESLKMASISKGTAKLSLRTEPKQLLERDIERILARYGFYDEDLNWRGHFINDFVDNGDGTITDKATGLMWEKSGCPGSRSLRRAKLYIIKLNSSIFAGYSDWRLPTIDELASLLERETVDGIHIDPLFDQREKNCWSSDRGPLFGGHTSNPPQVWHVNFLKGTIGLTVVTPSNGEHGGFPSHNYVRAVRTVK
jgi:hypothetical protein